MNLAPPSGPASIPSLPAPLTQPSIAIVPPTAASPSTSTAGQAVLALTARYGKDLPVINSGLVWRVFSDRPDETGTFKMIREDHSPTPNIVLPPGNYVVHVVLGLVSAVRAVSLKAETDRESFVLPAGGLRIDEPAADLAVATALASSLRERPVREGTVLAGELSLPILSPRALSAPRTGRRPMNRPRKGVRPLG